MPPASNTPTTVHELRPNFSVRPTSVPTNWAAAPRPTISSLRPDSKARPCTIFTLGRTANASGPTPRRGTFATVFVLRFSKSTMTNSSPEATGPFAPRRTPAASPMIRTSSRDRALTISLSEPARITTAVSGDPVDCMVARKPSAIESTAMNTATTPAIPTMATMEEPSRWRIVRMFSSVTIATCDSQPMGPRMIRSSSARRRCAAASPGTRA